MVAGGRGLAYADGRTDSLPEEWLTMLGIFADSTFEPVLSLFESIDWAKLPIPAGVTLILSLGARPLARWYLRINVRDLQGQIDLLTGKNDLLEKNLTDAKITTVNLQNDLNNKSATLQTANETIQELHGRVNRRNIEIQRLTKFIHELQPYKSQCAELQKKLAAEKQLVDDLQAVVAGRDQALDDLTVRLALRHKELDRIERRFRRALKLQGYLTHAKALQTVPKFRPLEERKRAVVSVLNLKGGVGKTTITAHVAGSLARKGYRVLMVDLDLQGSLSSLMLPLTTIKEQFDTKKLAQHFFRTAAGGVQLNLTAYAVPVPAGAGLQGSMHIVPCTDHLAYAELNLTLGWLLRQGKHDARFLLRKALHSKDELKDYDIVLLDCPPILNISCVNALAASDYLLTPTILSHKATERVPILMRTITRPEFVNHVNCHMKVMGIVASRTTRAELGGNDAFVWENIPRALGAAHVAPIKQFKSIVAQDAKISASEEQYLHPDVGSRARKMFDDLANELEQELPHDCRIAPPASVASGT